MATTFFVAVTQAGLAPAVSYSHGGADLGPGFAGHGGFGGFVGPAGLGHGVVAHAAPVALAVGPGFGGYGGYGGGAHGGPDYYVRLLLYYFGKLTVRGV